LNQVSFDQPAAQVVLDDYRVVEQAARERVRRLELALRRCAEQSPQLPLIAALQVLRGIAFLSAVTIVAEVGDFRRFTSAPGFMCFTGLVTSEHSSGTSRRQGGITRAGNRYLRHVLVQGAHNARYVPNLRGAVQQRLDGLAPDLVELAPDLVELALRAQQRLHARYRHLDRRIGRPKAVTAVARELAGFVWAVGRRMSEALAPAA
jgi:transposase